MPIQKKDATVFAKPRNDAYTGMLAISLGAMITGTVLLFIDYSNYPDKKPEEPKSPVTAKMLADGPPAAAPQPGGAAPPPAGAPGVPPAGAPPAGGAAPPPAGAAMPKEKDKDK